MPIKYPYEPESAHPQYLWNEHEFIIRALTQNKIGVGVTENGNNATLYLTENNSFNNVARGLIEFPIGNFTVTIATTSRGWVYLKANGSGFSGVSSIAPIYNQYHHGWYASTNSSGITTEDRAVIFVDNEQEAGYRCIVMDSFNCHFEFNHRIADTGGTLVWSITAINTEQSRELTPGKYRFLIRGGKGGNGGSGGASPATAYAGGAGANGLELNIKLTINKRTTFTGLLGGNGFPGESGLRSYSRGSWSNGTGGGGGSSGQDTYLKCITGYSLTAIGGAGGGGGFGRYSFSDAAAYTESGAGGGGAGYGTGGNGANDGYNGNGNGGTINNGGTGGSKYIGFDEETAENGYAGQNLSVGNRRNGGNSGYTFIVRSLINDWTCSEGGNDIDTTTNGIFEVYKMGDLL
jgi:hypothetical protein